MDDRQQRADPSGRAAELAAAIVARARGARRSTLLETESLDIVSALGLAVPERVLLAGAHEAASRTEYLSFPGARVVVKVVSPEIAHKSACGGVEIVGKEAGAVRDAVARMERRFRHRRDVGYAVFRFVEHDRGPGGELLIGMRWSDEFGPVVTVGPGGVAAELLAEDLRPERAVAVLSPQFADPDSIRTALGSKTIARLLGGGPHDRRSGSTLDGLVAVLQSWLAFAEHGASLGIRELEVNPLALTDEGPVALDALGRIGPVPAAATERPLGKLHRLLEPRSAAIVGVSRELNPGRLILGNMLRAGFPRERLFVIKAGQETIDGCRCLPDLDSLPAPVDLLILAIDAAQVPATVARVLELRCAESLIVIPGGLGELAGSEGLVLRMRQALDVARRSDWQGPLIHGGNCLGVRSRPGRYDTLFIPGYKLPRPRRHGAPLALICQSGAFAVARLSRLADLDPRYVVTVGNQFDLTVGDYLTGLAADPQLELFACYVEGFQPLDGARWIAAVDELRRRGKTVLLYRAGRTAAGARAGLSHTASIAGDYRVVRELARTAGAVVAESVEEFDDLILTFSALHGRRARGWRLGAVTNAGFECVALADALGRFELAELAPATTAALRDVLKRCRLERVVAVRNPLDVTPIADDAAFATAVRTVLLDPHVDVGIVGCVPLTGSLSTLPAGDGHREDLQSRDSVVARLGRLRQEIDKPFVVVVDGGPRYDPMVRELRARGLPTFRTADRALRTLETFCRATVRPG